MFGSDNFRDKSPLRFFKILKLPSFFSGNFIISKNALAQFIPNPPPKLFMNVKKRAIGGNFGFKTFLRKFGRLRKALLTSENLVGEGKTSAKFYKAF